MPDKKLPRLLVLASTYPRWADDHEPRFVHELARNLTSRFRVTVVCPHARGAASSECMDGVNVRRYRYAPQQLEVLVNDGGILGNLRHRPWRALLIPGFLVSQAWAVFWEVRREHVDAIHAHWLIPQGLVVAMLKQLRLVSAPMLVSSHGADLFALRGGGFVLLKRFVLRKASAITVVSQGMVSQITQLGVPLHQVNVEPMGVDLVDTFRPVPGVQRLPKRLLFVGRLVEKKGLRHLLDALPTLVQRHPALELLVAGFGPEEEARREQVDRLGLSSHVRFLGPVEPAALPELYTSAALFIAPFVEAASGDQDGLGLVTVEALGCQCPVVVSELPATRGLIDPKRGIHAVRPGSPGHLAEVINRLLEEGAKVSACVDDFDWSRRAEAYSKLIEELIE